MRKSIATVSLSGTLEEKLAAAAQVGFDGVELFENDVINCALGATAIRDLAAELGVRLELYQPLRDLEAVPAKEFDRNRARAEHKFALMADLGVDMLLACSSVSPLAVDDDALAAEQLYALAEAAAGHGIRIAYEALAWGRFVNDYRHAWRIVADAGHPNLGLCLDSFHILSRGDDPAGIRAIPGEKIFFLQLADAPSMHLDVLQWSRHFRCFPGQGAFDLPGFVDHVIAAGYAGPLSLEVFNDVFRQADAERTATDALRSLIVLEESLAGRQTADTRERLAVRRPAEAVELSGFSFVELAVDSLTDWGVQHLLRGLGFTHTGRHRSKPVQMWRQGEACILLNRAKPGRDGWLRGEAMVSAIGVEGDDPGRSAQRAQTLLAPAIPRRYGPGEADLFATEAPDGTSVFFCRTDPADPASWLGDFELIAEAAPAGDLVAIDYVGLSQPAFAFYEAALFYQSVLGLRRRVNDEIADPYGLVRSLAVSNDTGRVRLLLNMPVLNGARLPESAGFHHVALRCDDIFATAAAMRTRGVVALAIPGNYYEDLAARTDLPASLIARMRDLSILYDRDTEDGQYFSFSSNLLGRRMFFEIVQRTNGYDGYGNAGTPARMAAQYRQTVLAGITG